MYRSLLALILIGCSTVSGAALPAKDAPCDIEEPKSSSDRAAVKRKCLDSSVNPATGVSGAVDTLITKRSRRGEEMFVMSPCQKKGLKEAGLDETLTYIVQTLTTALLRDPIGKPLLLESYFNAEEIDIIKMSVKSLEEFSEMLSRLKRLYPHKLNPSTISLDKELPSPPLRIVMALKRALRSSYRLAISKTYVKSLSSTSFQESLDEETSEERFERQRLQHRLFLELERKRGTTDASRGTALSVEEALWGDYFNYVRLRITGLDEGTSSLKIIASEIEQAFERYLSVHYTVLNIGGCKVYLRREDIILDRTNFKGISNAVLMEDGLAPVGPDGKPMNLHHLTRRHPGYLVLITDTFHKKFSELLHLRSEDHMRQPKPIDRAVFAQWKSDNFPLIGRLLSERSTDFGESLASASAAPERLALIDSL